MAVAGVGVVAATVAVAADDNITSDCLGDIVEVVVTGVWMDVL